MNGMDPRIVARVVVQSSRINLMTARKLPKAAAKPKTEKPKTVTMHKCKDCGTPYRDTPACPNCGSPATEYTREIPTK